MKRLLSQYQTFIVLMVVILAVFVARTLLAIQYNPPRLSDLFTAFVMIGSLVVLIRGYRCLGTRDWLVALAVGGVVGVGMLFTTLFSPYPFFGIVRSNPAQGLVRGLYTTLAVLGGLVIMRQGGPVQFHAASGAWRKSAFGGLLGLAFGLPLAVLNVFALQISEGKPIQWQSPLAALLDALQPGIVEEVLFRFALWGLLWLVLRKSLPTQAVWLSGLVALLVHNFAHFDDLFLQAPLVVLGMGTVMAAIWGLPMTLLARKRGLESSITFHWIQDVARFFAGY